MAKYVAAIDQGTTGTRCMIFDHAGAVVASRYEEHRQVYPQPGWVEHDALEIWHKVKAVTQGALESGQIDAAQLVALGITNQRETTLVWDKRTGQPYHNAIVWQCTGWNHFSANARASLSLPTSPAQNWRGFWTTFLD
jgi:glycerol kinase